MSSSDEEEDETVCPLCAEEMDLSDKNFLPCPCGYRVSIIIIYTWYLIYKTINYHNIYLFHLCIGLYMVLASYSRKFKWIMSSVSNAL